MQDIFSEVVHAGSFEMEVTKEKLIAKFKGQCIIHHHSQKADDTLTTLADNKSWQTLLNAAKIRNHGPIIEIAQFFDEEEFPKVTYHRTCRSLFTMKRDLDKISASKRKSAEDHVEDATTSKRPARASSTTERVYKKECIFCDKVKYMKNSRTREKLILASELRVDEKLRSISIQRNDQRIMAVTSRDIVAAEAHYHSSCYKDYTRGITIGNDGQNKDETYDQETEYQKMETEAFIELLHYIEEDVIGKKQVMEMVTLRQKLELLLQAKGVNELKESTKKHLSRRLESELGNSIHIYLDNHNKLLVVPGNISFKDAIVENQILKRELALWKSKEATMVIDKASSCIRSNIQNEQIPTPFPYHPSEIENSLFKIPQDLERFLLGLLTGDPEQIPSNRVTNLITSFSQDVIYAVTCGRQKPPKHWMLPYAVKTLTGNIEVIQILNRLGHAVSCSQLQENDTALCLQKMASSMNEQTILPASIKPYVFTNLAWDNIDRLEETLTGKGTTHRVNGIAVQPRVYGPELPCSPLPGIRKTKQRSIATGGQQLETYISGERTGPHPLVASNASSAQCKEAADIARKKTLAWVLTRQAEQENKVTPSWTGFNIETRDTIHVPADTIGYLPTINGPATDMTTVSEILSQSENIRKTLKLQTIVVVMDQALYSKAAEILWKHKNQYENIVLRMGAFHIICNALTILGKRFQDAGLRDILIESGIVAEGSVSGVLDGKTYNRAVRVHKYVYESLMRLAWKEFLSWTEEYHVDNAHCIKETCEVINELAEDTCQQNLNKALESEAFRSMQMLWNTFLEYLRNNNGDLSSYWMSYVDFVEDIILGLLRSSREGNWPLHLNAVRSMIPWCFAYDKVNYARYLPVYHSEMMNLPRKHPDVQEAFMNGYFSVQLSGTNPFGRLPVDQTTEVTINKDTQTPGGTSRFSLKSSAVNQYYMIAEHRSAFLRQIRDMTQPTQRGFQHAELQKPRAEKDEKAVLGVMGLFQTWINPFAEKRDIICISTANIAPANVASDLLTAYDKGEERYATFKAERLENAIPKKKFHDPIKAAKLMTFSNILQKKKQVNSSGRAIILKADRALFGRIIVMAQSRDLQMAHILSHPLGPLPWALASPDGTMRKTNKATLASCLQKNITPVNRIPDNSASVIDGMSLVYKVKGNESTFGDIARSVLSMAVRTSGSSTRIDVVFDVYRQKSIKSSERTYRGEDDDDQELQSISSSHIVRQWRRFISKMTNKTRLICFFVKEWTKPEYALLLQGRQFFTTAQDRCYKILSNGSNEEVSALRCTQEEADGRLLLHAAHASREGYQAVVLCAEDTDVLVMSLAVHDKIATPLFQRCATSNRVRVWDLGDIRASEGTDLCKALIGLHAFTGCDSVSALAGKGKASALKILRSNKEVQNTFAEVGIEWDLSPSLMARLETFTCLWYALKSNTTDVNALRYNMFCSKKGEIESHQLPPCRDCLLLHAQRANYQAAIWRR